MVAIASPTRIANPRGGTFLAVHSIGQVCLIPIGFVGDVGGGLPIVHESAWPTCFLGHTRLKGVFTPVVDLAAILGTPLQPRPEACVVAVFVRLPTGRIMQYGLLVDQVPRLVRVPARSILPPTLQDQPPHIRPFLGTAHLDGTQARILDVARLVPARCLEALFSRPIHPQRRDCCRTLRYHSN